MFDNTTTRPQVLAVILSGHLFREDHNIDALEALHSAALRQLNDEVYGAYVGLEMLLKCTQAIAKMGLQGREVPARSVNRLRVWGAFAW